MSRRIIPEAISREPWQVLLPLLRSAGYRVTGNPELTPETSRGLTVGFLVRAAAFAEGERSAVARAEQAQADALADIAAAARQAFTALAAVAHEHRVASADLALACAEKIADAALAAAPQAPVQAALAALSREIEGCPRLMARVAPDSVERVQAAMQRHQVAHADQPALRLDLQHEDLARPRRQDPPTRALPGTRAAAAGRCPVRAFRPMRWPGSIRSAPAPVWAAARGCRQVLDPRRPR